METDNPIAIAVKRVGSVAALAALAGVTPQAISQWRNRVPAERVLLIESLTGISRHVLRPDVFGARADSPAPRAEPCATAAAIRREVAA
jgi:DNA-binding transcriptional regulator YdaS (Cro superfamily)